MSEQLDLEDWLRENLANNDDIDLELEAYKEGWGDGYEAMNKDNKKLKRLLRECRELFEKQGYLNMVDKIDNAIGEKK